MINNDQKAAADISMQIMAIAVDNVKIGATGEEIDQIVGIECEKRGVTPAFLGVGDSRNPFPKNLCIGINEQILHTIPNETEFRAGDLIKVDFGIIYKGYYTDHCVTIGLEPVAEPDKNLIRVGKLAVESAVDKAKAGIKTGDLGYVMQSVAEMAGYNVLKDYVGHGIGKTLWQKPEVPAYGTPGTGTILKTGDVICIEAQVVAGSDETSIMPDGWTIVTKDGKKGVMFEYMVEIGAKGAENLTNTRDWHIFK